MRLSQWDSSIVRSYSYLCKRTSSQSEQSAEPESHTDQEAGDADSPQSTDACSTSTSSTQATEEQQLDHQPPRKKQHLTASEKKKIYKARLSYKREWEKKYPWVTCRDPSEGMFCATCQKWGKPPAGSRGAWTTRGITDWHHATELLKNHADSHWHRDAAYTAAMAQQVESGESVLELQRSSAAIVRSSLSF